MTENEAFTFAVITGFAGVFIMWQWFNLSSALIGVFSLFLYAFIYTPLKKINSVAVLVGAFPGALPCLIGWVAATNEFSAWGMDTYLQYSFYGSFLIFGQLPGWPIKIIQRQDLNYCQAIKDLQNLRHCKQ